jgi:hypothetical protein
LNVFGAAIAFRWQSCSPFHAISRPFGGSVISVGSTIVGEVIDCALPSLGPWPVVGVSRIDLSQTAFQLAVGRIWIEGMAAGSTPHIPIAPIGDVCRRIGPHDLDITGAEVKGDGLPQGPLSGEDERAGHAWPPFDCSRLRATDERSGRVMPGLPSIVRGSEPQSS